MGIFEAMRPRQWPKNFLVLAAPIIYGPSVSVPFLAELLIALVAFIAISSATYIINDLFDREQDRAHLTKRFRPIASGRVSVGAAAAAAFVLAAIALTISWWLLNPSFASVLSAYAALMVAYVLRLRSMPIIDILTIAAGFVSRAAAGSFVVGVTPSPWFLFLIVGVAILVSAGRRVAELAEDAYEGGVTRPSLIGYSTDFLDSIGCIGATLSVVALMLWVVEVGPDQARPLLAYMSVLPAFYALFKYLWHVLSRTASEPERLILADQSLSIASAIWVGLVVASTI